MAAFLKLIASFIRIPLPTEIALDLLKTAAAHWHALLAVASLVYLLATTPGPLPEAIVHIVFMLFASIAVISYGRRALAALEQK